MNCAFEHGSKCKALTTKCCEGCRFRKTKKEVEERRKRVKRRINSLPEELQAYIRNKDYTRS